MCGNPPYYFYQNCSIVKWETTQRNNMVTRKYFYTSQRYIQRFPRRPKKINTFFKNYKG